MVIPQSLALLVHLYNETPLVDITHTKCSLQVSDVQCGATGAQEASGAAVVYREIYIKTDAPSSLCDWFMSR